MKFLDEDEKKFSFNLNSGKEFIVIILLSLILIINLFIFFSNGPSFIALSGESNKPPLSSFCSLLSDQLMAKQLSPKMVEESVFQALTKSDYSVLEFKGKEKLLGSMAQEKSCVTYIRDDLGVRALFFSLEESSLNHAYYKVTAVKENF